MFHEPLSVITFGLCVWPAGVHTLQLFYSYSIFPPYPQKTQSYIVSCFLVIPSGNMQQARQRRRQRRQQQRRQQQWQRRRPTAPRTFWQNYDSTLRLEMIQSQKQFPFPVLHFPKLWKFLLTTATTTTTTTGMTTTSSLAKFARSCQDISPGITIQNWNYFCESNMGEEIGEDS